MEQCDDGNIIEIDVCLLFCTLVICGDGLVYELFEECDDSNMTLGDWCSGQCKKECALGDVQQFSGGSCIMRFDNVVDWFSVKQSCELLGGYLVSVSDAVDNVAIVALVGEFLVWIGLIDQLSEGAYFWVEYEGALLVPIYFNWKLVSSEGAETDCVVMDLQGFWDDVVCDQLCVYFCEYDWKSMMEFSLNNLLVVMVVVLIFEDVIKFTLFICSVLDANDLDGDVVILGYQWWANSVVIVGQSESVLDGAHFSKGQSVFCCVIFFDSQIAGVAASSVVIVIQNALFFLSEFLIESSVLVITQLLICIFVVLVMDVDGDDLIYYYWWYRDGDEFVGQIIDMLVPMLMVKYQVFICMVQVDDGEFLSELVIFFLVMVFNSSLMVPMVIIIFDLSMVGEVLICEVMGSFDADADFVIY